MPGAIFENPMRPTVGQGSVWTETLGGRLVPGSLQNTGAGLTGFTDNHIPFGSALGGLETSSSLTWDGTTFSVTGACAFTGTLNLTTASAGLTIAKTTGTTLAVSSTQASTTITTGCATFAGGIGIAAELVVGGSPTFASASPILTLGDGTGTPGVSVNGAAATNRDVTYRTAGSRRWAFRCNNTAESGSNAGSNFSLTAFDDAGSSLGVWLQINRSDGLTTLGGTGSIVLGSGALATTATDGFLYIPSCAGAPTGVPTAKAGRIALIVDSTNNKLYFYSGGAWRDAGP